MSFDGKSDVERLVRTAFGRERGASKKVSVLDDPPQVVWQSVSFINERAGCSLRHRGDGSPRLGRNSVPEPICPMDPFTPVAKVRV